MSTVIATSLLPESTANDTLTIGGTGDSVVISGGILEMNTLQDAGGNTIFASNGSGTITSQATFPGALKLIQTAVATGSDMTMEFTSGLDATYDLYGFQFVNFKITGDNRYIGFQVSLDGGSTYATTCTSTVVSAAHAEDNSVARLTNESAGYGSGGSTTGKLGLTKENGSEADSSASGWLYLFSPSSTTFVKHWFCTGQMSPTAADMADTFYTAGYFNTTSAVNAIQFSSFSGVGTIASGSTMKFFGFSKS